MRLDMRTLEAEQVELDLGDHVLAVLDSGASRSLAESGYNERREECRRAPRLLGVESLRDATDGAGLPDPLDRRVRHVVTENERVDAAVAALGTRDPVALGELLDRSHASLRDDYEVSVPEVERAVTACSEAGALGARIMGGGFGGSVLALFPPGAEPPSALFRFVRLRALGFSPSRSPPSASRPLPPLPRLPSSSDSGRVSAQTRKNAAMRSSTIPAQRLMFTPAALFLSALDPTMPATSRITP